jgi:hypothetical protein
MERATAMRFSWTGLILAPLLVPVIFSVIGTAMLSFPREGGRQQPFRGRPLGIIRQDWTNLVKQASSVFNLAALSIREALMPTIVSVHGTFADGPEEGDQWWQRGSPFERHLLECVEAKEGILSFQPLLWDGRNSEVSRQKAAAAVASPT